MPRKKAPPGAPPKTPAPLPKITGLAKKPKLPGQRHFPIFSRGWKRLHLGQHAKHVGWITEPPPGFVGAHTSRTEWWGYEALAKITGKPHDPTKPPFTGAPDGSWMYQVKDSEVGGRIPGGSVTDYQVRTPTGWIGIRLDTERWHTFAPANKQMQDLFLKTHLKAVQKVVTIYDDFLEDDTGREVCRRFALAMQGIELPNPIRTGTARRVRPTAIQAGPATIAAPGPPTGAGVNP